jgi:hypothetical protein
MDHIKYAWTLKSPTLVTVLSILAVQLAHHHQSKALVTLIVQDASLGVGLGIVAQVGHFLIPAHQSIIVGCKRLESYRLMLYLFTEHSSMDVLIVLHLTSR